MLHKYSSAVIIEIVECLKSFPFVVIIIEQLDCKAVKYWTASGKFLKLEFNALSIVSSLTSLTSQVILNFRSLFKIDSDISYLFKT